tara:strand:+ start:484 stop:1326 length:843 start_codon:yes stop_codon:yes gene_type:complete
MEYLLTGTPQTASNCVGGVLYDSGGSSGSYNNSEDYEFLIKPWAHNNASFELNVHSADLELNVVDHVLIGSSSAAIAANNYYKLYKAASSFYVLEIRHGGGSALSSSIMTGSNFGANVLFSGSVGNTFDLMSLPATVNLLSDSSSQVAVKFVSDSSVVFAGFKMSWTASCGKLTDTFFDNDWGRDDPGTRLYPAGVKEINTASSDHDVGFGEPVIIRYPLIQRTIDGASSKTIPYIATTEGRTLNQSPFIYGPITAATIRQRFTASITNLNSNYKTGSIV